jgi:hypothetical protein
MRDALHLYSDILLLREEAFRSLKHSWAGWRFALLLFVTVTLLAGCGMWLGLPAELQRPSIAEQIDRASDLVARIDNDVTPTLQDSLQALSAENLSVALGDLLPPDEQVTPEALAVAINRTGASADTLLILVNQQTQVPPELFDRWSGEAVTAEMITDILDTTDLSAVELRAIMLDTAISGALSDDRIQALAGGLPTTIDGVRELLVSLMLTPQRVREITVQLGLTPEAIERLSSQISQAPDVAQSILDEAQAQVERLEPPLGVRFSRLIHFLGRWLSTPFAVAVAYLPLALVAMIAARILGGRATLKQHLVAMALAVAPAVLLFLTYAGNLSPGIPVTSALGIQLVGRVLGLIAIAWIVVILVKSLAVAHDFSYWRAIASLALAYVLMYAVAPLVALFSLGYILRG